MKYNTIVIDPPWPFDVWSKATGNGRSAESHYHTMTWEELGMMGEQLNDVAARNCALCLWVCRPSLPQALQMVEYWNSSIRYKRDRWKYKTELFTWVKTTRAGNPAMGMGYWTRANTEGMLLFTRGSVKRKSKSVRQVIMAPSLKHSAKPEEAQNRIEQLLEGPYLEVFARRQRENWTCIGNEISGNDICHDLKIVSNIRC